MSKASPLVRMLHGHAKELQEIAMVLSIGYAETLKPLGWQLRPVRAGAQSWMLYKGNTEFHFRKRGGKGKMEVLVYDNYWKSKRKLVAVVSDYWDAVKFIEKAATL